MSLQVRSKWGSTIDDTLSRVPYSLLDQRLVDELRVIVNPVLLGDGFSLFAGLHQRVALQPLAPTVFRSGNVLLRYRPITDPSD